MRRCTVCEYCKACLLLLYCYCTPLDGILYFRLQTPGWTGSEFHGKYLYKTTIVFSRAFFAHFLINKNDNKKWINNLNKNVNQSTLKWINKNKRKFSISQTIRNKSFFQQLLSNIYGQELLVLAHLSLNWFNIKEKSCETKRNSQEKKDRKILTKDQTKFTGFSGFAVITEINKNKFTAPSKGGTVDLVKGEKYYYLHCPLGSCLAAGGLHLSHTHTLVALLGGR